MAANFLVPVKSTLDKVMNDLVATIAADNPTDYSTLAGMDVDDIVETDQLLKSVTPLLIWQHGALTPHPRDPLYQFEFMVGAKTNEDKGNYLLMDLAMRVHDAFKVDTKVTVEDYSGVSAVPNQGYFVVTEVTQAPQVFENQAGLRMWQVMAKGARRL